MGKSGTEFFITGGTLPPDAPCYVERHADRELYEAIIRREFCYVLTARQMGKSSLMVRAAARLRRDGCAVAVLDLTAVGQNLTPEQWYDGLLTRFGIALHLEDELDSFWLGNPRLGPLQRFMDAIREVVLPRLPRPVEPASAEASCSRPALVIFVDEIDTVRSLPFSTDEFFAAIRECYNRRSEDPRLGGLVFCLLGVAAPSDLIRDARLTPFNVGRRIDLGDFRPEEAASLEAGFSTVKAPRTLLQRILFWTGGHPYLTQRLCRALEDGPEKPSPRLVDERCSQLFFAADAEQRDDNLSFVRDRVLRGGSDPTALLELYGQVRRQSPGGWLTTRRISDSDTDPLVSALKLSSIVRAQNGALAVRNRIYERVFDLAWIRGHLPGAELARQRAAFRRGVLRASLVAGTVVAIMGALAGAAFREAGIARRASGNLGATLLVANQRADRLKLTARQLREALTAKSEALAAQRRAYARLQVAEHTARELATRAAVAETRERDQRFRAEAAEQEVKGRLWHSYLMAARAGRWSGRPGRRFDSLEALRRAALFRPTRELRNEAIACMALPDMRVRRQWSMPPGDGGGMGAAFDATLARYAAPAAHGAISIRRVSDDRELTRLPARGERIEWVLQFSLDGNYIAAKYGSEANSRLAVWSLARKRPVAEVAGVSLKAFEFSPDNRSFLVARRSGQVATFDLATGKETGVLVTASADPYGLRVDPAGQRVAISWHNRPEVVVVERSNGQLTALRAPAAIRGLSWAPDGATLAGACAEGSICIWNPTTTSLERRMPGTGTTATQVEFDPSGTTLISSGWDGLTRLWDVATGRELVAIPGEAAGFNRNGDRLAFRFNSRTAGIWEVERGEECCSLPGAELIRNSLSASISPTGDLGAIASQEGASLWELSSGRKLGSYGSACYAVLFAPDGNSLVTSGAGGVREWPLQRVQGRVGLGAPRSLWPSSFTYFAAMSEGGHLLAVADRNRASVRLLDPVKGAVLGELGPHPAVEYVSVSPDGEWVASGTWQGSDVKVWSARTRSLIANLPVRGSARVGFSPDGRMLITSSLEGYATWEVGTWRLVRQVHEQGPGGLPGPITFTADGKTLAIAGPQRTVRLLDAASGKELATVDTLLPMGAFGLALSPNGGLLLNTDGRVLRLGQIRRRLAAMGLDWQAARARGATQSGAMAYPRSSPIRPAGRS